MRRDVDIEDLLVWAFGSELPKVDERRGGLVPRGATVLGRLAGEGSVSLGHVNRFGATVLDGMAGETANADAVAIGDAVLALESAGFTLSADVDVLADQIALTAAERAAFMREGMARVGAVQEGVVHLAGRRVARLIQTAAMLRPLDWADLRIEVGWMRQWNGEQRWFRTIQVDDGTGGVMQMEADGFNPRTRRPYPGAYRKRVFDPPGAEIVVERLDYQAWLSGMDHLADVLRDELTDYRPLQSRRPWEPWGVDGPAPQRRILSVVAGA